MITALFFIVVFTLIGLEGYLLWALQQRLESLTEKLGDLSTKVREGEHAIVENFGIIEKRFTKVENEIKNVQRSEPKAKEALKAAIRAERSRDQ